MKIKRVARLVVAIMAILVSSESTAWSQKGSAITPSADGVVRTKFDRIVGRNPTPTELSYWKNVERSNQIKGLNVPIDVQIMDWFVAPPQAADRSAMIEKAYNFWFKRPATKDEHEKCEKLVRSKRIAYEGMVDSIYADLAITHIADVAGDPKAINVTIANLGSVSTSRKTFLGLEFCSAATCIRNKFAAEPILFEVPPIAPNQNAVVKVTSTTVLQQSINQRAYYVVVSSDWNFERSASVANNLRCVPGLSTGKTKVLDQKLNSQLPKSQVPQTKAPSIPKKP